MIVLKKKLQNKELVKKAKEISQEKYVKCISEDKIVLFHDCAECNGCGACEAICPLRAISMEEIDGFYYPNIEQSKCVKCKQCLDVCPLK